MPDLKIPTLAPPQRGDELWRHTCCEAFVGSADRRTYYEFNFSPSTAWAAYRFDSYRAAMSVPAEMPAPAIVVQCDALKLELHAEIDLLGLRELSELRLGLSAVIEERSGVTSYWALAHAPGKPDFHNADCFKIDLGPV